MSLRSPFFYDPAGPIRNARMQANGLELSCPAEAGGSRPILAHVSGPGAPPYGPARRVSFSELLARSPMMAKTLDPVEWSFLGL